MKMFKILLIVISSLILCGCSIHISYDYYEYKDLEGNTGIAEDCFSVYGKMRCELKDGTMILVQSYRGVYE